MTQDQYRKGKRIEDEKTRIKLLIEEISKTQVFGTHVAMGGGLRGLNFELKPFYAGIVSQLKERSKELDKEMDNL